MQEMTLSDERLLIGADVVITISGVKGSQVRFAIDAPRHVEVDRREKRIIKNAQRRKALRTQEEANGKQQTY